MCRDTDWSSATKIFMEEILSHLPASRLRSASRHFAFQIGISLSTRMANACLAKRDGKTFERVRFSNKGCLLGIRSVAQNPARTVTGSKNHAHPGILSAQLAIGFQPAQFRHDQVQQHAINFSLTLRVNLERLLAVFSHQNLIASPFNPSDA